MPETDPPKQSVYVLIAGDGPGADRYDVVGVVLDTDDDNDADRAARRATIARRGEGHEPHTVSVRPYEVPVVPSRRLFTAGAVVGGEEASLLPNGSAVVCVENMYGPQDPATSPTAYVRDSRGHWVGSDIPPDMVGPLAWGARFLILHVGSGA